MNSKSKSIEMEEKANTESLHGDGSQNQTNNSESSEKNELITWVEGTPFAVIEEEGFYVIMGKYRMSEKFNTKEEAVNDAKSINWMRILQVIGAVVENYEKEIKI